MFAVVFRKPLDQDDCPGRDGLRRASMDGTPVKHLRRVQRLEKLLPSDAVRAVVTTACGLNDPSAGSPVRAVENECEARDSTSHARFLPDRQTAHAFNGTRPTRGRNSRMLHSMPTRWHRILRESMPRVDAELTFWNAGEGLFHSGLVRAKNAGFRYVFDCGSRPKRFVDAAVRDALSRPEWQSAHPIDLLVLSHLHYDHMSGIPGFVQGRRVRVVIMPYLSLLERLVLAVMTRPNAPHRRFLAAPATFARREWGAERVIMITKEDEGTGELVLPEPVPNEPEIDVKLGKTEPPADASGDGDAEFRTTSGRIAFDMWVFAFFLRAISAERLAGFQGAVDKLLGGIDQEALREAIVDGKKLSALTSVYKPLASDFNETSLVMYSGTMPGTGRPFEVGALGSGTSGSDLHFHAFNERGGGTLLTGDLSLPGVEVHLTSKFAPFADRMNVLQASHHGADASWSLEVFRRFGPAVVIPSRINHRYHPSRRVLAEIFAEGGLAVWANEEQSQTIWFD